MYVMTEVVSCADVLCFFFKQKTAYEMRISDWSSDVCSSDLSLKSSSSDLLFHRPDVRAHIALQRSVDLASGIARRSEERRVGKEGVSTCRSRGSPFH